MSASDMSPDESGYVTSRNRRDDPNLEEYDPSEHGSEEDTADSSVRMSTPVVAPASEGPSRGPRTIRTARKRVLPLRNVTFTIPSIPSGEPSQSRPRSQSVASSSPAIGVPVPRTQGMTDVELEWTTRIANEVELHRHSLSYFRNSMNGILEIMQTQDSITNRVLEIATDAEAEARRVHAYLLWVIGILVVLLGLVLVIVML